MTGRRKGGAGLAICSLLLVLTPPGCSYRFSAPPPARPLQWEGECSTSRLPVAGDVLLSANTGSLALVTLIAAAASADNASEQIVPSWDPQPRTSEGLTAFLVVGALSAVSTVTLIKSAAFGVRSARDCRAAQAELRYRQMSWPPPAWVWPPPPGTWPTPPAPGGPPAAVPPAPPAAGGPPAVAPPPSGPPAAAPPGGTD